MKNKKQKKKEEKVSFVKGFVQAHKWFSEEYIKMLSRWYWELQEFIPDENFDFGTPNPTKTIETAIREAIASITLKKYQK